MTRDFFHIDSSDNFHEGLYDVEILEGITSAKSTKIFPTLAPLKVAASNIMIKRTSKVGITYGMMKKEYVKKGKEGIVKLLTEDIGEKKPRVTKNKKIINKIIELKKREKHACVV